MARNFSYPLEIAGLRILLQSPVELKLHAHLQPFLTENTGPYDARYRVVTAHSYCLEQAEVVYSDFRMQVRVGQDFRARCYYVWDRMPQSAENPILFSRDGKNYELYVPVRRLAFFADHCDFSGLLALEQLFAQNHRLFLHSSAVLLQEEAVLFSAAAGTGKSTHAALWERCFGAEILNGDRCVIEQTSQGFVAHGSCCCGSSDICRKKSAPLRGIYLLRQSPENRVCRIPAAESFRLLLEQTVLNLWNPEQVENISRMLTALVSSIPIRRLDCRPDREAAVLAKENLFSYTRLP